MEDESTEAVDNAATRDDSLKRKPSRDDVGH